ncbi:MAG: sugar transferase, partial [Deltaproteobacteria bacterium]|nr:sugar transferase [Deltaproteobacteria bacterium]
MLKRYNQLFLSLRVLLDVAIVTVAFFGAWNIRFGSPKTFPFQELPSTQDTLVVFAMAIVLWPLALRQAGLYRPQRQRPLIDEVFSVVRACGIAGILLVAATVFAREARYSRGMLVVFTLLSMVGVGLVRFVFKEALNFLRARGYNRRFVLVLGAGRLARQTIEAIELHKELGFHAIGCLSVTQKKVGEQVSGVPVIGTLRALKDVLSRQAVDMVLVALPSRSVHHLPRVMRVLEDTTVDVKLVPDVYQYATLFGGLEEFGGLPIVNLQSTGVLGMHALSKRVFDLVLSTLFIAIASPILLTLALLVKLTSRGPVFFRQERVGLDGQAFQMLKFRTMKI